MRCLAAAKVILPKLRHACRLALSPMTKTCKAAHNRLAPPALILLYHRVTTLAADPQLLAVTPENFRAQMAYLKENFTLVRLEDDWSQLGKPAVVVTFDDGYADNVREALPILEELEVPATFFVATSLVGTDREFWWDEVERVLLSPRQFPPHFQLAEGGARWATASAPERERMYRELLPILKAASPETREEHLERLRSWAGVDAAGRQSHRVLSRDELRRLGASPVATVGAHTVTHSALSTLPPERQREEIVASKTWLEELLGREVPTFSYPFGSPGDYTAETADLCRQAGFFRVAANYPGQWRAACDPYQLPRQIVRNWDLPTFKKKLRQFWIS